MGSSQSKSIIINFKIRYLFICKLSVLWYYSGIRRNALCNYFRRIWRKTLKSTGPKYSSDDWQDKSRSSIFLAVILTEESCSTCIAEAETLPSRLSSWTVHFYSRTIAWHKKTVERNIEITKSPKRISLKRQKCLTRQSIWLNRFELVIMDPPYRLQEIVKDIERLQRVESSFSRLWLSARWIRLGLWAI